jgi:hypothetical protein
MPLLVGPDGSVREIGEPGRLLGLAQPYEWSDQTITIQAGETLVLYTDGVTDTRGSRERFGDARLHELLAGAGNRAPAEQLARLDAALASFQVGAQADDTAVLALRLQPAEARAPGRGARGLSVDEGEDVVDTGQHEDPLHGGGPAPESQAVGVRA